MNSIYVKHQNKNLFIVDCFAVLNLGIGYAQSAELLELNFLSLELEVTLVGYAGLTEPGFSCWCLEEVS